MLVFLDTEFTDFTRPDLISLALVAEDGREFYAERKDFRRQDCSDFVCEEVFPLLGRVADAACTRQQLTQRLRDWFEQQPEPAKLVFDFEGDWLLLANAWLGPDHNAPPANVGDKILLASHTITHPVFEGALNRVYNEQLPPHHALADARGLMAGYRAWKAFMEPLRRIR